MFTAYTIHPHIVLRRNGNTPYEALQSLFTGLMEYNLEDAKRCSDFWDMDIVQDDYDLIGKVEGYCGAIAFECVVCDN
jgi:hypothetical protein